MHVRADGDWAEITLREFGRWREPPPEPAVGDPVVPRGRGLLLMSAFSDVRVEPGANGTTVTLRVPRERAGSATPADDGRLETLASTG
jgi:hypothetical protein